MRDAIDAHAFRGVVIFSVFGSNFALSVDVRSVAALVVSIHYALLALATLLSVRA